LIRTTQPDGRLFRMPENVENTIICGDCLEVMKDWPE